MFDDTPAQSVERDYVDENRELRERVRELEWKVERVRRAWQVLSELAAEPAEVTSS